MSKIDLSIQFDELSRFSVDTSTYGIPYLDMCNIDTYVLLSEISIDDVISHHTVDGLLEEIDIDKVIRYHSVDNLLDKIGKEEAMKYFDLIEN